MAKCRCTSREGTGEHATRFPFSSCLRNVSCRHNCVFRRLFRMIHEQEKELLCLNAFWCCVCSKWKLNSTKKMFKQTKMLRMNHYYRLVAIELSVKLLRLFGQYFYSSPFCFDHVRGNSALRRRMSSSQLLWFSSAKTGNACSKICKQNLCENPRDSQRNFPRWYDGERARKVEVKKVQSV